MKRTFLTLTRRFKALRKDKREQYLEIGVLFLILLILGIKVSNYAHIPNLNPLHWVKAGYHEYQHIGTDIGELKYFGSCPKGELKIDIGQQYLCRGTTTPSVYQHIYDTYPRNPNGNEALYPFFDQWSQTTADDFLKNQFDVPRSQPAHFSGQLTWTEDPYKDQYWRFNFYSLRIFKDLLDAASTTHDPKYTNKLLSIVNSFDTVGVKQPIAWQDDHAVAWRTMMLIDIWWKLRAMNQLPITTSNQLLAVIQQHGAFLADPAHYEPQYNHGTNEAAALYELGVSFPTLPGASQWLTLAEQRLDDGLTNIIDNNGALTEHSPYYDFYALVKYWDIFRYSQTYHKIISAGFSQKIQSMLNYATYILEPNDHTPIIGSSIDDQIHDKDEYAQMAAYDPYFKYVLTRGQQGTMPKSTAVQFLSTGQTIMRSGWQTSDYTQQTQLIFNYSSYITHHSQLDNLSIELFGGGQSLLTGPGLYTYTPGAFHDYFFGTTSQNTVLVDNTNQRQGGGEAGPLTSTKDYTTQSASNQLNMGVTQQRQVTMIGKNLVVVVDKLHNSTPGAIHKYQQLFHLAPGLQYSNQGLTVTAKGNKPQQQLTITQVLTNGLTLSDVYNDQNPSQLGGICSVHYGQIVPCHQVAYTQKGSDATFITLLQIGKPDKSLHYSLNSQQTSLAITKGNTTYTLAVQQTNGQPIQATTTKKPQSTAPQTPIDPLSSLSTWQVSGGAATPSNDTYAAGQASIAVTSNQNQEATISKNVNLDLTNKNLLLHLKLPNPSNVKTADFLVYSNGAFAQNRLKDSYEAIHDNDSGSPATPAESPNGWSTISLSKGSSRDQQGQWSIYGSGFDWSHITAIDFRVASKDGTPVTMMLGGVATTPGQNEGKVVIVFDDGSASILSAAASMKADGFDGNIAVIGKYTERQTPGYLTVPQLKTLQQGGWSLINHTYNHEDAITQYYERNDLAGFQNDVLSGALFLQQNGLNTDPNWYIYPHGTTNQALQQILSKYYTFARTELTAPESYPFGNPLAVKDFVVEDQTTPPSVYKAIDDARTYNQTLLLTFHRIHTPSSTQSGYDIANFNAILAHLKSSGIAVMSFNQLDTSNNIPIPTMRVTPDRLPQLKTQVTVQHPSWWHRFTNLF